MAIRIGIYDFFAYTVPGGLMLLLGLGVLHTCGYENSWALVDKLNTLQTILLIIAAYLTGYVLDPLISQWAGLFEPKNIIAYVLTQLEKKAVNLSVKINPAEWGIWFTSIRRENLDLALEIDRWMAISKMLRGVSFFMLSTGIWIVTNALSGKFSPSYLLVAMLSFGLCWSSVRQALRFKKTFYMVIFETIVSRQAPYASETKFEKDALNPPFKKED